MKKSFLFLFMFIFVFFYASEPIFAATYNFAVIGDVTKNSQILNIYEMFYRQGISYKKLLPSQVTDGTVFNDVDAIISFVDANGPIANPAAVVNFANNHIVISHGYDFAKYYYPSYSSSYVKIWTSVVNYTMDWGNFRANDEAEFRRTDSTLWVFLSSAFAGNPNIVKIAEYRKTHTAIFHMKGLTENSGFYVLDINATTNETEWPGIWHIFPAVRMVKDFPVGKYARLMTNGTKWWDLNTVNKFITSLVNENSDIASKMVIGKSVQGRDINAIFIGKGNQYAIIDGCIHGNEKTGAFSALRVAELLIDYYHSDPSWQTKLNEYKIIIVPVVNPDGFVANNRTNAHNKDLNRQFPPGGATTEPEAWAIRNLFDTYKPVIYFNFHEGGSKYPSHLIYGAYQELTFKKYTDYSLKQFTRNDFKSLKHWGYYNESGVKVWIGDVSWIGPAGITSMAVEYSSKYYNTSSVIIESFASGSRKSLWGLEFYPSLSIGHLKHYDHDGNFIYTSNSFITNTNLADNTLTISLNTNGITTSSTVIRDLKDKGRPNEVYIDGVKKLEGSGWIYYADSKNITITGATNSILLNWGIPITSTTTTIPEEFNREHILNYLNDRYNSYLGTGNIGGLQWIIDGYDMLGVTIPNRDEAIQLFNSKQNDSGCWFEKTNHYVPNTAQLLMVYNRSGVKPAKSLDIFFSRINTWEEVKADVEEWDGGTWGGLWGYVTSYVVYKHEAPPWTPEFLNKTIKEFDSWAYDSHQRTHLVMNLYALNLSVPRIDEVVYATLNEQGPDGNWSWSGSKWNLRETVFNIFMLGMLRDQTTVDKSLIDSAIARGTEYVRSCYNTTTVDGKTYGFFYPYFGSTNADAQSTALGILTFLNPTSDVWTRWFASMKLTPSTTTTTIKPLPTTTIPLGAVAYWKFDENFGTTAFDSSSYNNNGIISGATWMNGVSNSALRFDGVNDYVNISDSNSLDLTNAITIGAWVYPVSWSSIFPRIVSKESGIYSEPYALELDRDGKRAMLCLNTKSGSSEECTASTNNSISLYQWYNVVGTWNGTTVKIYVNGQLVSTRIQTGTMNVTKNNVLIGNNPSKNRQFNGTIDEVKIWNKALSVDEIRNEYELVTTTTTITSTTTSTTSRVTSTSTSTTSSTTIVTTTSTITTTTLITTTIPSRVELTCSGSTSHWCSTTYKSVSSIDSIMIASTANCGNTIPVTIEWSGMHNYNDNHWGFFIDSNFIDSCKSLRSDSGTNSYRMSCSVKMPVVGTVNNGVHTFTVTGEDYSGYCNPSESGIDAQKSTSIILNNCQIGTTTSTVGSTTVATTTVATTSPTISTTISTYVDIICSSSTSHYCSTTYKSIDFIESLSIPNTAKCGDTVTITVYWIGRHNFNDNHWGLFLETVTSVPSTYLYYLGSCKSYVADSGTNSYRMSCSVKIPVAGSISNGNYNFWVIGEDYSGYCNPGELGIDAQKYKVITLSNC